VKKHLKPSQQAGNEKSALINPVLEAIKDMFGD